MNTTTQLDRLIAEEDAAREASLARAAERGGLPGLAEAAEVEKAMRELYNVVERYAMDAKAVTATCEVDHRVPFKVTAENVAALALIAEVVGRELIQIRQQAASILPELWLVEEVRQHQAGERA